MRKLQNYQGRAFINLGYEYLRDEGCRQASMMNWSLLQQISLYSNEIGAKGCEYISNAHWPQLTFISLSLHLNILRKMLLRKKDAYIYHRLNGLSLLICNQNKGDNNIQDNGCKYIRQSCWPRLKQLHLGNNRIGVEGCMHLSHIHWEFLQTLYLDRNKIQNEGCKFLTRLKCSSLNIINLSFNRIGNQGCGHLIRSKWPRLRNINLENNIMNSGSIMILGKGNWPFLNLIQLKQQDDDVMQFIHTQTAYPFQYVQKQICIWIEEVD